MNSEVDVSDMNQSDIIENYRHKGFLHKEISVVLSCICNTSAWLASLAGRQAAEAAFRP